jgi:ankyrin repeat protein
MSANRSALDSVVVKDWSDFNVLKTKLDEKTHPQTYSLLQRIYIDSPSKETPADFTGQQLRFVLSQAKQLVLMSEELETLKIKHEQEKIINESRRDYFRKDLDTAKLEQAAKLDAVSQKYSTDIDALRREFDDKLNMRMKQMQQQLQEVVKRIKTSQDLHDEMLLDACQQGDHKKMQLTLDLGANPEVTDSEGSTPFFRSVFNHHYDLASALLKINKSVIDVPNNEDKTILQVMSEKGDIDAVKFIVENMPKTDKEAKSLLAAYESAQLGAAQNAAACDAIKQVIADAILFQAAKQGNLDLAKNAIEKGANKNAQNISLDTPLHASAYAGHANLVKYLLSLHASIVRCNRNKQTAISVASSQDVKDAISFYQNETATMIQAKARGMMARTMFAPRLQQHRENLYSLADEIINKLTKEKRFDEIRLLATELDQERFQHAMEMIQRYKETQVIALSSKTKEPDTSLTPTAGI